MGLTLGCTPRAAPTRAPVVEVPTIEASGAEPAEELLPERAPPGRAALGIINDRMQRTPNGDYTVTVDADGRVLKYDKESAYEEDFFLRDVARVDYELESGWADFPHVARVFLVDDAITRFRYGSDEEWTVSTIFHVSFVFADKQFALDVVQAFRDLVATR